MVKHQMHLVLTMMVVRFFTHCRIGRTNKCQIWRMRTWRKLAIPTILESFFQQIKSLLLHIQIPLVMYALYNAVLLWLLQFSNLLITSYSSNWIIVSLPCTSVSLDLHCDRFDHDLRQLMICDPVDLVVEDDGITLSCPLWCNCEGTLHPATLLWATVNEVAAEYPQHTPTTTPA